MCGRGDVEASTRSHVPHLHHVHTLEVASALLLALDGFEERLEVALAERARALALDDLVEDRRAVLDGLGKDLQQVAVGVAVDEDAELGELVDRLVDGADAALELVVVGRRDGEELRRRGCGASRRCRGCRRSPSRRAGRRRRRRTRGTRRSGSCVLPFAGSLIGNLIRSFPFDITFDISDEYSVEMS